MTAHIPLSSRTLPTGHSLSPTAVCPTSDLILLQNAKPSPSTSAPAPPPTAPAQPKLSLIRQAGAMDHVWDWTPPPPPPPPPGSGGPGVGPGGKPLNRLQMMRDKGKGKAASGDIRATAWSAKGDFVAVVVSNPSGSTPTPTLHLVDLHTGKSQLPPIALPTPSSPVSHISWHPPSAPPSSHPVPTSSALAFIAQLPPLPTLSKEPVLAAPGGPGGPAGAGGAAGPGSALFGAKAAMLQKEREKEAGRPVSLETAAPGFPTLLPAPSAGGVEGDRQGLHRSLLLVGDERGRAHVFLGGSVRLGAVETGGHVFAANVVPGGAAQDETRVVVLAHDFETDELRARSARLALPPTLLLVVEQSTALRRHLAHACESLQQARVLWDEARRLGKAWMDRLAELSKSHGVDQPPATQLLLLLATGRATPALSDYLSSKMNERSLAKWESSTAEVLSRLKNALWMSVCPALERTIILLDELRAWHRWPAHFAAYDFDRAGLDSAVGLAKQVVRVAAVLEREVAEEERCFGEFGAWMKYELEKVAAADGSDVSPRASFEPRPVAHYLRHCLTESAVSPFLAFGLSTASLDSSVELKEVRAWVQGLEGHGLAGKSSGGDGVWQGEGLEGVLKRTEELRGQLFAQWTASRGPVNTEGSHDEGGSTRAAERSAVEGPVALPALLHVLVETVSGVMERAIGKVGKAEAVGEPVVVGLMTEPDPANLPGRVKSRLIEQGGEVVLLQAWIDAGSLHVVRLPSASEPCIGRARLATTSGNVLDPIGWDFLSDTRVALAVAEREAPASGAGEEEELAKPTGYVLGAVDLAGLAWGRLGEEGSAVGVVRWAWEKGLDVRAPPEGVAVGVRGEVVLVGGEGRRVEVWGGDGQKAA